MQPEKVRFFILAKELGIEGKDLLVLCGQNGIDVKSQLCYISPEVATQVRELVRCKLLAAPAPPASNPPAPIRPVLPQPAAPPPAVAVMPQQHVPPRPGMVEPLKKPPGSGQEGGPGPTGKPPTPALRSRTRYEPQRNHGIERLLTTGEKAGLEKLDCIPLVAEIDTECAMFKIRQITERLCRKLVKANGRQKLDNMIGEIDQQHLLGKKAVTYLRQIQNLGNQATHNTDDLFEEEFNLDDVNNAAEALACVLDAALKHKRLG
jgi:hypothetical protein